jgi:hypothetical protein
LLDKGEDVPKWEQNMSAEDIIKAMCEEHQISREELLDAFNIIGNTRLDLYLTCFSE